MATSIKVSGGDISISQATGKPILVSSQDKLKQDLNEFFNVDIQPNGFGCGLDRLVGSLESGVAMIGLIDRYISDGVSEFIRIQRSDLDIYRDTSELVDSVADIQVAADPSDPSKYYIKMNILTMDGASIPYMKLLGK